MKCLLDGQPIIENVIQARSMLQRMRGLLGKSGLPEGTAMLIEPCGSIHTFGMKFTIDLLFLDNDLRVTRALSAVGPGRMVLGGKGAKKVLEMQTGWLDMASIKEGCLLSVRE